MKPSLQKQPSAQSFVHVGLRLSQVGGHFDPHDLYSSLGFVHGSAGN